MSTRREFLAASAALVVLGSHPKTEVPVKKPTPYLYKVWATVDFKDNSRGSCGNYKRFPIDARYLADPDALGVSYSFEAEYKAIPILILNKYPDAVRIEVSLNDHEYSDFIWWRKFDGRTWAVEETIAVPTYAQKFFNIDAFQISWKDAPFTIEGEGPCRVAVSSFKPLVLPPLPHAS